MSWCSEVSMMTQKKQEEVVAEEKQKYDNAPRMETKVRLSEDGKWLIHKTTITSWTHINYLKKIGVTEQ